MTENTQTQPSLFWQRLNEGESLLKLLPPSVQRALTYLQVATLGSFTGPVLPHVTELLAQQTPALEQSIIPEREGENPCLEFGWCSIEQNENNEYVLRFALQEGTTINLADVLNAMLKGDGNVGVVSEEFASRGSWSDREIPAERFVDIRLSEDQQFITFLVNGEERQFPLRDFLLFLEREMQTTQADSSQEIALCSDPVFNRFKDKMLSVMLEDQMPIEFLDSQRGEKIAAREKIIDQILESLVYGDCTIDNQNIENPSIIVNLRNPGDNSVYYQYRLDQELFKQALCEGMCGVSEKIEENKYLWGRTEEKLSNPAVVLAGLAVVAGLLGITSYFLLRKNKEEVDEILAREEARNSPIDWSGINDLPREQDFADKDQYARAMLEGVRKMAHGISNQRGASPSELRILEKVAEKRGIYSEEAPPRDPRAYAAQMYELEGNKRGQKQQFEEERRVRADKDRKRIEDETHKKMEAGIVQKWLDDNKADKGK